MLLIVILQQTREASSLRIHRDMKNMGLTNIRLGDYIERSTVNNKELKYGTDLIVGVN